MKQYKQKGIPTSGGAIVFGVGCALLVSILAIAGGAELVNSQILPESGLGWMGVIIPFMGVLGGTVLYNTVADNSGFVPILVIGGVYLSILVAANILFFDSQFEEVWRQITGALAGMLPCVLHGLGITPAKKPKYRYRK